MHMIQQIQLFPYQSLNIFEVATQTQPDLLPQNT